MLIIHVYKLQHLPESPPQSPLPGLGTVSVKAKGVPTTLGHCVCGVVDLIFY